MAISKRVRFEVLKRDSFKCYYCGNPAGEKPLTIDHVVPVALGGSDDVTNLVAACPDCNSGKSSVMPESELVEKINVATEVAKAAQARLMRDLTKTMLEQDAYESAVWDMWDYYTPQYAHARVHQAKAAASLIYDWHAKGVPMTVIEKGIRIAISSDAAWTSKWSYAAGVVRNTIGDAVKHDSTEEIEEEFYTAGLDDGVNLILRRNEDRDILRHHIDGTTNSWIDLICRAA